MTTPKETREFWVYKDLLTGAAHFSIVPIKDSTIYECMNHLIEYGAYEQLREENERLKASVEKLRGPLLEQKFLTPLEFELQEENAKLTKELEELRNGK